MKNQYRGGRLLKKGGLDCLLILGGTWQEKGRGAETPMHTIEIFMETI